MDNFEKIVENFKKSCGKLSNITKILQNLIIFNSLYNIDKNIKERRSYEIQSICEQAIPNSLMFGKSDEMSVSRFSLISKNGASSELVKMILEVPNELFSENSKEKIDSPLTHEEVGMKDVYRYREIYTFHYNLVANESGDEKDESIIKEENSPDKANDNIKTPSITSPQDDLIDLEDYKYIEIPNTKKDDFFYNILVIIRQLLSITFFS